MIVSASPSTFRLTGSVMVPADITNAESGGPFSLTLKFVKGANTFREYSEENLTDPSALDVTKNRVRAG